MIVFVKNVILKKQRIYSINYHEENKEKRNDYHKGHYDNHKKEKEKDISKNI